MKRIANLFVLVLAVNFAVAAGGVGWLASSGHLTKSRVAEVRRVLFPPPATQPSPATTPAALAPEPPDAAERLGEFVAHAAGRPSADGSSAGHPPADIVLANLDDRRRELLDLQQQVELGQAQLARDREALRADRAAFTADHDRDAAAAADKGFQDSLALYRTLPPKQVKAIFATLPDEQVQRYLQAMDAKQATKVMKEFKSAAETDRLQRVLERIRTAQAATTRPAATPVAEPTAAVPDGR